VSERVSDDWLAAFVEGTAPSESTIVCAVEELRARRAADLTDGDRESLTWLLGQVEAWIPHEYERRADALAALARVLGGGE
jgi:hypothetical protein